MLLAKRYDKVIEAYPNGSALCPHCDGIVISKCGEVKIWHWAHKVECPYHTEPETQWHLQWKEQAHQCGYDVEVRNNDHILDAFNPSTKTAIEFQHSPILLNELRQRCIDATASGFLINWLFDYTNNYRKVDWNPPFINQKKTARYIKIKYYNRKYDSILQNGYPIYGKIFLDFSSNILQEIYQVLWLKRGYSSLVPVNFEDVLI